MTSDELKEEILDLIDDVIDEKSLLREPNSFVDMLLDQRGVIHCVVNGEDHYFKISLEETRSIGPLTKRCGVCSRRGDMPGWNGLYHKNDLPLANKPITTTGIWFRLDEFERSPAMERLRQGFENTFNQVIERVCLTPIQFRFPKSKKKRIRKKWRKDPGNFRPLVGDLMGDIEIVA